MSLCHLNSYVLVEFVFQMCIFFCIWLSADVFPSILEVWEAPRNQRVLDNLGSLEEFPEKAGKVRVQKTFEQQFCFTCEVFCPIGSDMFCTLCDSLGRSFVFACCNNSCAISVKSRSTLSQLLAEVWRKYIPCLLANSSPTSRGISWSSRSILFPTNTRNTLGEAYSSISLNQSGQQSKVG